MDIGKGSSNKQYHKKSRSFSLEGTGKKLGLVSFVMLTFYSVSGGAFGIEDIVRAGGPLFALLGFSLILVWAVPEALITAELSTALPEASGSVAWVSIAFGPLWGFQMGWISWLNGVADNSLYPILFLDCLVSLFSGEEFAETFSAGVNRWCFILIATVLLTYLNYRGLEIVGWTTTIICILSLMPFVVFCIVGMGKLDPSRWLQVPEDGLRGVDWKLFLNTFFWNINYWESAACYSGEVANPGYTYPRGMALALLLVTFATLLPVLVGTGASTLPWSEWRDGSFTRLAREIVGPWLGYWMIFASAISNIGMFEAEMSGDAWQVAGMAERGILPKVLGYRNCYDTPTYGILMSASGVICLCWLSFSEIIEMLNLLFCFGQLIEFAAFIQLRIRYPHMPRPYMIPLGTVGMCVMLAFPTLFVFIILSFSSLWAVVVCGVLIMSGFFIYRLLIVAKERKWCEFENQFEDVAPHMVSSTSGENGVLQREADEHSHLMKHFAGYS